MFCDLVFPAHDAQEIISGEYIDPNMLPTKKCVLSYLDDLALWGDNMDLYMKAILGLLIDISNTSVLLSPSKCVFLGISDGQGSISWLGYDIDSSGKYKPSSDRRAKLNQLQRPVNLKQLMSVIGFFNYHSNLYGEYGRDIKQLYAALTRNSKCKGKDFMLEQSELDAFERIKQALSEDLTLYLPRKGESLFLEFDANASCASSVLYCIDPERNFKKVVSYYHKIFPAYLRENICNRLDYAQT